MPQKKAAEQAERTWGVGRPLLYAAGACAGASGLYIAWQWLNTSSEEEKDRAAMLAPESVPLDEMKHRLWDEGKRKFVALNRAMLLADARRALDNMGSSVNSKVRDRLCAKSPGMWLIREQQQDRDGLFVYSSSAFAKEVQTHAEEEMASDSEPTSPRH